MTSAFLRFGAASWRSSSLFVCRLLVLSSVSILCRCHPRLSSATSRLPVSVPDAWVFLNRIALNGGRLLLHDDFSENGETPAALGGSPITLHLYVSDVDEAYERSVAAGAESLAPPEETFWGDRYAQIKDPAGHLWSLGTRKDDLSIAKHEALADEWSKGQLG